MSFVAVINSETSNDTLVGMSLVSDLYRTCTEALQATREHPEGPWGVPEVPWTLPGGSMEAPWESQRLPGDPWRYLEAPWRALGSPNALFSEESEGFRSRGT